jgi:hypothetical protein
MKLYRLEGDIADLSVSGVMPEWKLMFEQNSHTSRTEKSGESNVNLNTYNRAPKLRALPEIV